MASGKHLKKGKLRTWWGEAGMMDRILLLLGVFLLAFTVCMVIVFIVCGAVPDTLITAVFALCGAEGGIMGWIKNGKERIQSRKWEMEDRKNFSEGENHNDE
jgi:hypothetical protein